MTLAVALAVAIAPFPASAQSQTLNLATMQDAFNRQAAIVKGDQKALNALTDKFTADAAGDLAPVVAGGGTVGELVGTTMDGIKTSFAGMDAWEAGKDAHLTWAQFGTLSSPLWAAIGHAAESVAATWGSLDQSGYGKTVKYGATFITYADDTLEWYTLTRQEQQDERTLAQLAKTLIDSGGMQGDPPNQEILDGPTDHSQTYDAFLQSLADNGISDRDVVAGAMKNASHAGPDVLVEFVKGFPFVDPHVDMTDPPIWNYWISQQDAETAAVWSDREFIRNVVDQSNSDTPPHTTYDTPNGPRTLGQITDELKKAGYSGPWDADSAVATYRKLASAAKAAGQGQSAGTTQAAPVTRTPAVAACFAALDAYVKATNGLWAARSVLQAALGIPGPVNFGIDDLMNPSNWTGPHTPQQEAARQALIQANAAQSRSADALGPAGAQSRSYSWYCFDVPYDP